MSKWINEGGIFYPVGDFKLYPSPGPGIFNLTKSPNPMDGRIGLVKVANQFEFPFKIYDLGIEGFIQKVRDTWNNEYFESKKQNLGVILNGVKGTGKTIASKILCNELELPVVIIPGYIQGMVEFISSLEFECVVFLDEAEKMFDEDDLEASQALLKVIDGAINRSRKLYVLTTNSLNLNENLLGRPGRIRYIKQFDNISLSCVEDYLKDNLLDPEKKNEILDVVDSLEVSTIDTLRALVDEINIHGTLKDLTELNLTLKNSFPTTIGMHIPKRDQGSEIVENRFQEFKSFVERNLKGGLYDWLGQKYDPKLDPEFYDVEEGMDMEIYLCRKYRGFTTLSLRYRGTKLYEGLYTNCGVLGKNLGGGWWITKPNDRGDIYKIYIEELPISKLVL